MKPHFFRTACVIQFAMQSASRRLRDYCIKEPCAAMPTAPIGLEGDLLKIPVRVRRPCDAVEAIPNPPLSVHCLK